MIELSRKEQNKILNISEKKTLFIRSVLNYFLTQR